MLNFAFHVKNIPLMKNLAFIVFVLIAYLSYGQEGFKPTKVWSTPDILTTSESVLYDANEKVLYVSCIAGKPTEKDGKGFISKVSLSGEIITYEWASGINAPKGMGIAGKHLYVTDIDRVLRIDLESGKIVKEFPVSEAQFLNDIIVDPSNHVYITDMASNKVYRISGDNIGLWISEERFESPNGLNFKNGELLVGTKNGIFAVNAESKAVRHEVKNTGGIDGLELFDDTRYIISDWSGKVQIVHPEKDPVVVFNTTDDGINAADIAYIREMNLLLVPTFFDNRVTAYEINAE
jgi:sugar lactone lactonase YvrE